MTVQAGRIEVALVEFEGMENTNGVDNFNDPDYPNEMTALTVEMPEFGPGSTYYNSAKVSPYKERTPQNLDKPQSPVLPPPTRRGRRQLR